MLSSSLLGSGWWGGRDAGVSADRADACLGERQAGAGQPALAAEDPGDLPVAVMLSEAADELQRVASDAVLLQLPGDLQREAELGPRAALPLHPTAAGA